VSLGLLEVVAARLIWEYEQAPRSRPQGNSGRRSGQTAV